MFGLVKKQTCISKKHLMLNSTPPPRHKRFNIKFVFKLPAEKLSFSLQTVLDSFDTFYFLSFSLKHTCFFSFWSLLAHHVNTMHLDGTLINWLKRSLKGK